MGHWDICISNILWGESKFIYFEYSHEKSKTGFQTHEDSFDLDSNIVVVSFDLDSNHKNNVYSYVLL